MKWIERGVKNERKVTTAWWFEVLNIREPSVRRFLDEIGGKDERILPKGF